MRAEYTKEEQCKNRDARRDTRFANGSSDPLLRKNGGQGYRNGIKLKDSDVSPIQGFPEDSLVNQYYELVTRLCEESKGNVDSSSVRLVRAGALVDDDSFSPMFTVITRTQGKRNAALEEMLLGLAAQTDPRFIIRLVGHDLSDEARDGLSALLDNCPPWIQDRLSFITVEGGGRSRPLNAALDCIETSYFVILDDDDLVFDNWIEAFASTAEQHPGKIIHSGVFGQNWESVGNGDAVINRAISSPDYYFCTPYNPVRQFQTNFCPIMGLAYPSFIVTMLGLRFDESLTTLEDWDFLMRSAIFCGVKESGRNTAIYRHWKNGESSHDLHDDGEWELNRVKIKEKLDSLPVLLPPGAVNQLTDFAKADQEVEMPCHYARLEVHTIEGRTHLLFPDTVEYAPRSYVNTLTFVFPDECRPVELAFFPINSGQVTLIDFSISLFFEDGTEESFVRDDLIGNGYNPNRYEWAFIRSPIIVLKLNGRKGVEKCLIRFKFNNSVSLDVLTGTKLAMRARSSLRRKVHHLKKAMERQD